MLHQVECEGGHVKRYTLGHTVSVLNHTLFFLLHGVRCRAAVGLHWLTRHLHYAGQQRDALRHGDLWAIVAS